MSRRNFTAEEITAGLLALVMWAGNARAAAKALRSQGYVIPIKTLEEWRATRVDEYNALREKHATDLEDELVRSLRETAMYSMRVQQKAILAAERRLDANKDFEPARTAAALGKTSTGSIDKLLALTGRPSTIVENRSPAEILRGLAQLGVVKFDDAPAPPRELPAGETIDSNGDDQMGERS